MIRLMGVHYTIGFLLLSFAFGITDQYVIIDESDDGLWDQDDTNSESANLISILCQNYDLSLNNQNVDCSKLQLTEKEFLLDDTEHVILKRDADDVPLEGSGNETKDEQTNDKPLVAGESELSGNEPVFHANASALNGNPSDTGKDQIAGDEIQPNLDEFSNGSAIGQRSEEVQVVPEGDNPPADEQPPTAEEAPVEPEESAPAEETALAEDSAPAEEAAGDAVPADDSAPAEEPAPAPVDEGSPAVDSAPAEEAPPAEEAAPAEDAAPVEKPAPAEGSAPAEELAPVDDSVPAEEPAPAQDAPPAEEAAPVEDAAPAGEVVALEEPVPVVVDSPSDEEQSPVVEPVALEETNAEKEGPVAGNETDVAPVAGEVDTLKEPSAVQPVLIGEETAEGEQPAEDEKTPSEGEQPSLEEQAAVEGKDSEDGDKPAASEVLPAIAELPQEAGAPLIVEDEQAVEDVKEPSEGSQPVDKSSDVSGAADTVDKEPEENAGENVQQSPEGPDDFAVVEPAESDKEKEENVNEPNSEDKSDLNPPPLVHNPESETPSSTTIAPEDTLDATQKAKKAEVVDNNQSGNAVLFKNPHASSGSSVEGSDTEALLSNSPTNANAKSLASETEQQPNTGESSTNVSKTGKDATILIVLFVIVIIIGAAALTHHFIKKRRENISQQSELSNGIRSADKNSQDIEKGTEMKPLIKPNNTVIVKEYSDRKEEVA